MSDLLLPTHAMTLSELNARLANLPTSRLSFMADDLHIANSYHVTEFKSGTFVSLDCGGNPDTWEETILQVEMDTGSDSQNTMTTTKFAGILAKVAEKVRIAPHSRLTIEAGTSGQPMRVYDIGNIRDSQDGAIVELYARTALCKPRHREIMQGVTAACCAPTSGSAREGACCAA